MKLELDFNVIDIDKVKTLIELLSDHYDCLPVELKEPVQRCLNSEAFELDRDWFHQNGFGNVNAFCDGKEVDNVLSINPHLKKISVYESWDGDGFITNHFRAKSCKVVSVDTGNIAIEW